LQKVLMTFISTRAASYSLPPAQRDRWTSIKKLIPITINRSGNFLPELEPETGGWCLNCADTFWQFRNMRARLLRFGCTKFSDAGAAFKLTSGRCAEVRASQFRAYCFSDVVATNIRGLITSFSPTSPLAI